MISPKEIKDEISILFSNQGQIIDNCELNISRRLFKKLYNISRKNKGNKLLINALKSFEDRMKYQKSSFKKIESLTEREFEIFDLILFGLPNDEIADRLFISLYTVESHRKNITKKLEIHSMGDWMHYTRILS